MGRKNTMASTCTGDSMYSTSCVIMNDDDTTLWEHLKHWRVLTCCIHDYVFHWCQHSKVSVKKRWLLDIDLNSMDNGLIVEKGKHKELLKIENGFYKKLYEAQFEKTEDRI